MSNPHTDNHAQTSHGAHPRKGFNLSALLVPLLLLIGLIYYFVPGPAPQRINEDDRAKAVAARIQKVGTVAMGDANRPLRSGEEVFKAQCTACHTAGVAGAPKFGDAGAWAPRLGAGYAALLNSSLKGKNAMGPQGGGEFNDLEIGRAVVYMANAAGGKLAEPAAPAPTAATPAAGAAAAPAAPAPAPAK